MRVAELSAEQDAEGVFLHVMGEAPTLQRSRTQSCGTGRTSPSAQRNVRQSTGYAVED